MRRLSRALCAGGLVLSLYSAGDLAYTVFDEPIASHSVQRLNYLSDQKLLQNENRDEYQSLISDHVVLRKRMEYNEAFSERFNRRILDCYLLIGSAGLMLLGLFVYESKGSKK